MSYNYNSLPSGPRSGARGLPSNPTGGRNPAPPSYGYNDPSGALFEKRSQDRRPPPSRQGAAFGIVSAPSEQLAMTNCIAVYPGDFQQGQHVLVKGRFAVTVVHDNTGKIAPGTVGAAATQRQWMELSMGDQVPVDPLPAPPHPLAPLYLQSIDIQIDFNQKGAVASEEYSADDLTKLFVRNHSGIILSEGQVVLFEYHGKNIKGLVQGVDALELADEQMKMGQSGGNQGFGLVMDKTDINFSKTPGSAIRLKSSAKKAAPNAILAPTFKFQDMGIGGLDSEFSEIFRRAFASRVFPPGLVEKLGIEHVKGILLYGPPGTGKTLIARQIGKMLNAREPKIVNGPEILSKYVGASEENIRKLFADAEKEFKDKGDESGLHIIIFDELDAIFKQRGSTNNGTGVGDSVVNQLLSKMDGVDQLNNILIIGMTNRKDMIDDALLRPGRMEVHMEISLPDEQGRLQILNIHTSKMRVNKVMDEDVDLAELAGLTKNFSGAEISGLIKSATSYAFNRHVKVGTVAGIADDVDQLRVNRADFMSALDEVQPAFGVSEEELQQVIQNGIIHYDESVEETLRTGKLFVEQVRTSTRTPLVSILLHGPPGAGKTALAATIAQQSGFPFIKLITPDSMVGHGEAQKISAITRVFMDSYKSPLSVIVLDNIERLLDWSPMGSRFSNAVLQTLMVLLSKRPPKGRRLLIVATTSLRGILTELGLSETFDSELRVAPISTLSALDRVIRDARLFKSTEEHRAAMRSLGDAGFRDEENSTLHIGIKKLLSMIEMARQEPDNVARRLTGALMGLGM